jgi:hypothetical protein
MEPSGIGLLLRFDAAEYGTRLYRYRAFHVSSYRFLPVGSGTRLLESLASY